MSTLIQLIGFIAWPVTVLLILLIFRRAIVSMAEKVERVETAGVKLFLDREKVEQLIRRGKQEEISEEEVAAQIVKSAREVDVSELRILRALFDEPQGRLISNYAKYYPGALNSLIGKGQIQKINDKYFLTPAGNQAATEYLRTAMGRTHRTYE